MSKSSSGLRRAVVRALGLAAVTTMAIAPLALAADDGADSFGTDRPAFVPSSSLTGNGNMQVETSVARLQDGDGPQLLRVWSTPTLVRLGMPNYEIRLESAAYSHVRTQNFVNTGMSDLEVGVKGIVPQTIYTDASLAWLVEAGFPSGATQLRKDGVRPTVQLIGQLQMPNGFAVGGTAGFRSDVDNVTGARYPTGLGGVDVSRVWNAQLRSYAELAGRTLNTAHYGGKNMMWDVGTSWRVLPQTQLDASFGHGLKDNDTDLAWSVGISRRFHPTMPSAMSHNHKSKPDPQTKETPSATTEDGK